MDPDRDTEVSTPGSASRRRWDRLARLAAAVPVAFAALVLAAGPTLLAGGSAAEPGSGRSALLAGGSAAEPGSGRTATLAGSEPREVGPTLLTSTPDPFALYACPGQGEPVGRLAPGDRVLVTARGPAGWLEIHFPGPALMRAWVRAGSLVLEAPPEDLPLGGCPPPLASPSPWPSTMVQPTPTPTPTPEQTRKPRPTPTPTPRRTKEPTPTPPPTPRQTRRPRPTPTLAPTPDAKGPSLSALTASSDTIYRFVEYSACGPLEPTSVEISVTARDPSGIDSVRLNYRRPGEVDFGSVTMTRSGGAYRKTIEASMAAAAAWQGSPLEYYVSASDEAGNSSRLPASSGNYRTIAVEDCS